MGLSTNLTGYWKLDETSTPAADSANSTSLTWTGSPSSTTGKIGNAIQLASASSQYLTAASNTNVLFGDIDFFIWAWAYLDSVGSDRVIIGKEGGAGPNIDYELRYNTSDAKFGFETYSASLASSRLAVATLTPISTATWYFVYGWHDAANNLVGCGVDAANEATTATTGLVPASAADAPLQFGRRNLFGGQKYWNGRIDEVGMLKNYIANSTERTWLYNSGTGRTYAEIAAYETAGQPMALRHTLDLTGARRFGRGMS